MQIEDRDRRLAEAAVQRQRHGERPTREQAAAVRRLQKARDESLRDEHYRTVPKGAYVHWSGKQYKSLAELASRYGMPVAGRTVSLPEVVRWVHQVLLGRIGSRLAQLWDAAPDSAPTTEELLARETLRLRRLKADTMAGRLVARDEIDPAIERFAAYIRRAGEALQGQFGPAAARILNEALEMARSELHDAIAGDGSRAE